MDRAGQKPGLVTAFGVRQLAVAFIYFLKRIAAASCRTPKAPCGRKNYAGIGRDAPRKGTQPLSEELIR
jgi:hypothetical protein